MNVISIEEKAFKAMKRYFETFVQEMGELCGDSRPTGKWVDNQDACQLLQISKRTLQYYRDYGKLPFSMIGGKCYYKVSDIEKLISESTIKNQ